ncbi:MAG TPA: hypothetical protein VFH76_20610 [Kribbella sp.]|nr:hypothetical protein [Kribbella sp.]
MQKRLSLLIAILFCGALVGAPAVGAPARPTATFPCTPDLYRAGTSALNITVATGVLATIITPASSQVYGYGAGKPSAGDIWMFNQSGGVGFVQLGWYLGAPTGLPLATQPRVFWGENVPPPDVEVLHAGPVLSWDTVYEFMITNPLDGTNRFNLWLQGKIIGRSDYGHSLNAPGFVGEVDAKCTTMHAVAAHGQPPLRTLRYRYGSWHYFSGTRYTRQADFYSIELGDIATDFAYGGG